jgi:hypothetical protein
MKSETGSTHMGNTSETVIDDKDAGEKRNASYPQGIDQQKGSDDTKPKPAPTFSSPLSVAVVRTRSLRTFATPCTGRGTSFQFN